MEAGQAGRLRRLCHLARVYGGRRHRGEITLTQEDIGEMAGTSRATVNRVLKDEERLGTVKLRRGRIAVVDAEALARRGR